MDAEKGRTPIPQVTENLVARLWDRQYPLALPLVTTDGAEVQVVYRGRRRWDRGPDFAGAMLAWPGARLEHGDVEIHVRSSDWRAHGHHRDRHYNSVVLHVVLWDDAPGTTARQDGAVVPVLSLASHLAVPLADLASGSVVEGPLPSPCWPGSLEDGEQLGMLLDRCGMERFEGKVARFQAGLDSYSPDELLYQGIAIALGYSQNQEPFRQLAEELPLALLRGYGEGQDRGGEAGPTGWQGTSPCPTPCGIAVSPRPPVPASPCPPVPQSPVTSRQSPATTTPEVAVPTLDALMLGMAGLLPSQRRLEPADGDPYIRGLEERWAARPLPRALGRNTPIPWQFFRVRPANFPTRRVAALAALVCRWPQEGLVETLATLIRRHEPKALPRVLEAQLLAGGGEGYWGYHWDFGLAFRRPRALIGRQRAAETVINVFLPLLAAWGFQLDDGELGERVRQLYRTYPRRGDNEISRYMGAQMTGSPRPPLARSACRQQGLLDLYRNYCQTKRCGRCPCGAGRLPQQARPRSWLGTS